jgi:two-component system OmpR family response regulator
MLPSMARILVVDDEPHILDVVRAYLDRDGHEVWTEADGESGLARALELRPDLIVLDVMLPGRSGFEILRELRGAGSPAAVVMLTARDDVIDRVAGLEIGADDYVTKPFEPRELVARVGAVLRRTRTAATSGQEDRQAGVIHFFDLDVDPAARDVGRGGGTLALTRSEFDLLVALVHQPGVALTREQLGSHVFGESFDAYDRAIDSHMKNLRRKLGQRPDGGDYIETLRGIGYRAARR